MLNHLREIGRRLRVSLGSVRIRPFTAQIVGKGAGGDRTYAIDREAEEIIIGYFEGLRQPCTIVSAERGLLELRGGGPVVLIDPIDGSRNAVSGVPFFCSSIAVCSGTTLGDMTAAYVVNLLSGDEYWAEQGGGAFCNGERITAQADTIVYVVAYEAQVPGRDMARIMSLVGAARRARCFGSTALDLALLANGSFSIFTTPARSRTIDFGAGLLLVKEAGGVIGDLEGRSIDHLPATLTTRTSLLAAGNEALRAEALRLLHG